VLIPPSLSIMQLETNGDSMEYDGRPFSESPKDGYVFLWRYSIGDYDISYLWRVRMNYMHTINRSWCRGKYFVLIEESNGEDDLTPVCFCRLETYHIHLSSICFAWILEPISRVQLSNSYLVTAKLNYMIYFQLWDLVSKFKSNGDAIFMRA